MSTESKVRAVTTSRLKQMKEQGEKISMITSYDYTMASIVDGAGIDIILVGDSAANVMAAILFATGHLPATAVMMGITPMILFRCFLLNGGFGLLFGWLYRKYGLRYAMLAHGGCHVISKLIWILFI